MSAVVTARGLRKTYGSTVAVRDVDLDVHRGEIVGVVGPNGAGKTTTVECLTGLRPRDGGDVRILGVDPQVDPAAVRRRVGCQLQSSELPARITVGEALRLYASFYPEPADVGALAEQLGLADRLHVRYAALSGGQRQRLSIALALVGRPEVAVLDELTTGLDPRARRDTWDLVEQVRDSGVTVLLVTHFMDEAERLCDRLVVIDHGTVVASGTPAGLVAEHSSGQRLRFRLAGLPVVDGVPHEVATVLAAVPSVRSVEAHDGDVVVLGDPDVVGPAVLALAHAGLTPVHVSAERGTLEDVVVGLTGAPLGDGSAAPTTARSQRRPTVSQEV